jgi:hypothetical protein
MQGEQYHGKKAMPVHEMASVKWGGRWHDHQMRRPRDG